MEELWIRTILNKIESKLDNIQEEMKRHEKSVSKRLDLLGSEVSETKKNTSLILKSYGISTDTKKTKQATLENWVKKPPIPSPVKVDLSMISGYTGGERKVRSQGEHAQEKAELANPPEAPRFHSSSDPTPLGISCNPTPPTSSSAPTAKRTKHDDGVSVDNYTDGFADFDFAQANAPALPLTTRAESLSPILAHRPRRGVSSGDCLDFSVVDPDHTTLPMTVRQPEATPKVFASNISHPEPSKRLSTPDSDDETMFEKSEVDGPDIFPPTPPPARRRMPTFSIPASRQKSPIRTSRTLDDFDRIPWPQAKEPNFAYKPNRAVRKKEERKNLPGWDCPSCRNYYDAIGSQLGPSELEKLRNKCSKHRSNLPELDYLENTPRYFWDPGFPSTQECLENGLIQIGERSQRQESRRRPY